MPANWTGRTRRYVFRLLAAPVTASCDVCGRLRVPCPAAVIAVAAAGAPRRAPRERRVCRVCAASLEQLFFGDGGLAPAVLLWWEREAGDGGAGEGRP
jgi:hypothetical protein